MFQISSTRDKFKVLLYFNPIISNGPNEISLQVICKFFYPLLTSGSMGQYKCDLKALSKSSEVISLGSCQLNLLLTSCFCVITTIIKQKSIISDNELMLKATIMNCTNGNCNNNSKWNDVTSTQLPIKLNDNEKLIWIEQCVDSNLKMKLLIGTPRSSPRKDAQFDLPLRIILSETTNKFLKLKIELNHSESLIYEENIRNEKLIKRVTVDTKQDKVQLILEMDNFYDSQDSSALVAEDLILQWKFKDNADFLNISAKIEEVMFDDSRKIMMKADCPNHSNTFSISVVRPEQLSIIPVYEKPLLIYNLTKSNEPYMLRNGSIKLYYLFDSTVSVLEKNVECRPYNSDILACPPNLKTISQFDSSIIENKGIFDHSLELRAANVQLTLDIEPEIIPENVWEISMQDHVLNKMKGWRGPNSRTSLLTNTDCENLYQIIPIKIYKKLIFYNQANQNTLDMMIDVTNQIKMKNIFIQPPVANIYRYGNNLIIQGFKEGDFTLNLEDDNRSTIAKKKLKVLDKYVSIKDLDVSCISAFNIISNLSNSSFFVNIYDLKFEFRDFNKSEKCLIAVDLIYSDNSRANIVTFPMHQFSMRFITNKEIIDVFGVNDMFYDYQRFNKETSFIIEIYESKVCTDSKLIISKQVNLDPIFETNNSKVENGNHSVVTESPKPPENVNEEFKHKISTFQVILYTVCSVLVIVLVLIILKFFRDCHVRKKLNTRLINRRNSSTNDRANLHPNDPFDNDYPPLLPSPGPQVGCVDSMAVALASPQSFWCLSQNNTLSNKKSQPFNRQYSLPVKGGEMKNMQNYAQPCPPLRWIHQLMPEESKTNIYTSQEALDGSPAALPSVGSPMCWSVTKMESDHSSGIGSLITNMDDLIKDPYDARDRFNRLSELPSTSKDKKENVYEAI